MNVNNDGNGSIPIRVHQKFHEEIQEIKRIRIVNGTDKKMKGDKRITLAIIRHEAWNLIKEDIINSQLKDEK